MGQGKIIPSHNTRGAKKTAVFGQLRVVFECRRRGTAVFRRKYDFAQRSSSPDAKLKLHHELFENSPYGLRHGGVSTRILILR